MGGQGSSGELGTQGAPEGMAGMFEAEIDAPARGTPCRAATYSICGDATDAISRSGFPGAPPMGPSSLQDDFAARLSLYAVAACLPACREVAPVLRLPAGV